MKKLEKSAEHKNQQRLFGFVGMDEPVPVPVVDPVNDPEFQNLHVLPSYDSPESDDGFDSRDMVSEIVDILDPEKLRFRTDVFVNFIPWILVCPDCNKPVEPLNPESVFAVCSKCNVQFFMVELVKWRSFRRKLSGDPPTIKIDFFRGR